VRVFAEKVHTMRARSSAKRIRNGFTLLEILVVIGIIGVLAALTAVAVTKVISGQRGSNTRTAMATIEKTLNEHWAYVVSEAKKETGLDVAFANIDTIFGHDSTAGERNRLIWIKLRLMEAFPRSYQEMNLPYPHKKLAALNTNPIIPANLQKYGATYNKALGGRTNDQKGGLTESSACLLIALSVMRNGTVLNADVLGSAVADTDNDGIKEFVDGWGNPLAFFRFPTGNKALQDTNPYIGTPRAAFADPVDPGGVLLNWNGAGRSAFEANVHPIASPIPFYKGVAAYVQPTIVSMGPNGNMSAITVSLPPPRQTPMFGLGLVMNLRPPPSAWMPLDSMAVSKEAGNPALNILSGADEEADNIYSFQLR
jgi:prepilin-type N-terminal cleavage/methylation domain-containing protein